ncbi:unnamed protein product, partial [Dovyalis caffra]
MYLMGNLHFHGFCLCHREGMKIFDSVRPADWKYLLMLLYLLHIKANTPLFFLPKIQLNLKFSHSPIALEH